MSQENGKRSRVDQFLDAVSCTGSGLDGVRTVYGRKSRGANITVTHFKLKQIPLRTVTYGGDF